jgi:hypothetical protein
MAEQIVKGIIAKIPEGYYKPSGKKIIRTTEELNVRDYATAQVYEPNLIPENIKKDVTILGIKGNCSISSNTNNIFIGAMAEYQEANLNNLIPYGTLVYITDDGVVDDEDFYLPELSVGTSSILGKGILGKMILG